ncbi:hypothetical protein halTADL_1849 [Halohasta litchfieldiae]|uniref:Uncharacterized protein n=1 Tax=Halohasta litchfieldiae TaxID=1073996 RepID=A0A1H6QWZ9_9EURY|nr:hypothetical protein [Halohasta litchfieldiae]ATW88602.1 hypothetical protein halTADL_1849 [Halohasta litchfieldiae]SEI48063.1 hypothetical protein SAMN05444271_101116 [Halohasta litchfieldiae]
MIFLLLLGLLVSWLVHISVYGEAGSTVANAAIESVPGAIVIAVVGLSSPGILPVAVLPNLEAESEGGSLGELDARRCSVDFGAPHLGDVAERH